ncbi:MAG: hypothetical protein Q9167_004334 [Letrouitia subvulpina]
MKRIDLIYRCSFQSISFKSWTAINLYSPNPRRHRSDRSTSSSDSGEAIANVRVGSSGSIELKIRYPPRPSPDGRIIIYLPGNDLERYLGPQVRFPTSNSDLDYLRILSASANATAVSIGYRLSSKWRYPVPIHDVLASFDWILKNLAKTQTPLSRAEDPSASPKIGVCGELVGGSLATMLAMTECHRSKLGICAAALGEPIVDWTSFQIPSQKMGNEENQDVGKDTGDEVETLRSARGALFPNIGYCLDPFASPLLFFRTPRFDIAPPNPAVPHPRTDQENVSGEILALEPKRRSHRKYPPADSDLRLPWTRIEVGTVEALKAQSLEMAELLQRSINTSERKRYEPERTTNAESSIHVKERPYFWKEPDVFEVGTWFAEIFQREQS